jgi:hypothetical protein
MRALIEARLDEIRKLSNGFPKTQTRWGNMNVIINNESFHISEIPDELWKSINNEQLMSIYERVIKRFLTQM